MKETKGKKNRIKGKDKEVNNLYIYNYEYSNKK